jgi:GNAT superfamily N-acetyltransferase
VALCDIEDIGEPDITLSDVLDMWNSIPIETDAWIGLSLADEIIGYGFVEVTGANRMDTCVFVHPQFKNQGIGSLLLNIVEERAHVLVKGKDGKQKLMNQISFTNSAASKLVEDRGYQFSRLYERMNESIDRKRAELNKSVLFLSINKRPNQKRWDTLWLKLWLMQTICVRKRKPRSLLDLYYSAYPFRY